MGFFAIFGLLLIFDDLTQYWWHRTCHNVPILYNLHRAHHDSEYYQSEWFIEMRFYTTY